MPPWAGSGACDSSNPSERGGVCPASAYAEREHPIKHWRHMMSTVGDHAQIITGLTRGNEGLGRVLAAEMCERERWTHALERA